MKRFGPTSVSLVIVAATITALIYHGASTSPTPVTSSSPLPDPPLSPRDQSSVLLTPDRVIIVAGSSGTKVQAKNLTDGAILNLSQSTWTPVAPAAATERSGSTLFRMGDAVVIWGGYRACGESEQCPPPVGAYALDTSTGSWRHIRGSDSVPSLIHADTAEACGQTYISRGSEVGGGFRSSLLVRAKKDGTPWSTLRAKNPIYDLTSGGSFIYTLEAIDGTPGFSVTVLDGCTGAELRAFPIPKPRNPSSLSGWIELVAGTVWVGVTDGSRSVFYSLDQGSGEWRSRAAFDVDDAPGAQGAGDLRPGWTTVVGSTIHASTPLGGWSYDTVADALTPLDLPTECQEPGAFAAQADRLFVWRTAACSAHSPGASASLVTLRGSLGSKS